MKISKEKNNLMNRLALDLNNFKNMYLLKILIKILGYIKSNFKKTK